MNPCRYLENSGCVGMCVNMCKIPTQSFFTDEFGLPLTMNPSECISFPEMLNCLHDSSLWKEQKVRNDVFFSEIMLIQIFFLYK
jgi:hypothetical protein